MENFGKFVTLLLAIIITPIINGFVFSKLWSWFLYCTHWGYPETDMLEIQNLAKSLNYL